MRAKILLTAILLALACAASAASVAAQSNRSIYTSLDTKNCRTLESDTSGAGYYKGQCPGVAGYKLLVEEGDLRQNVTVVAPGGRKHSLELWSVFSGVQTRSSVMNSCFGMLSGFQRCQKLIKFQTTKFLAALPKFSSRLT